MTRSPRIGTRISGIAAALSPVWVAFVGSIFLSLTAIATHGILNRDGMLYVDTARFVMKNGLSAAHDVFAWPLLPILMAVIAQLSGLDPETAGQLLNTLFMAGACALLVASSKRLFPEAVWPICLVLLAVPGFNDYRNELLRECGCWFFVMLAFWLALRWADMPRWRTAGLVQAALVAAALFRPEALVFLVALPLWQTFEAPKEERWRRVAMLGFLPAIGLVILAALFASGQLPARLAADFARFSPDRFSAKAQIIAPALHVFARDNAATILFFGSLAIIPLKFGKMMGLFLVPLLHALFVDGKGLFAISRLRVFAWAFLAHTLVLAIFVTDLHFLAGRYVSPLILFAAPLVGYGLAALIKRFPFWRWPIVALALLIMVGNVLTLSPGKTHYIEAGRWLSSNATDSPRVFMGSPRTAYYAGWQYWSRHGVLPDSSARRQLGGQLKKGDFDLVVLEVSRNDSDFAAWLNEAGMTEIQRFSDMNGDAVSISVPGHSR